MSLHITHIIEHESTGLYTVHSTNGSNSGLSLGRQVRLCEYVCRLDGLTRLVITWRRGDGRRLNMRIGTHQHPDGRRYTVDSFAALVAIHAELSEPSRAPYYAIITCGLDFDDGNMCRVALRELLPWLLKWFDLEDFQC